MAHAIDTDGLLLNLKFTAVGSPGSVSPLTWENMIFNEGEFGTATAWNMPPDNLPAGYAASDVADVVAQWIGRNQPLVEGICDALLVQTAEHLRTRKQFGSPLARFQVLQHRIAELAIADLILTRARENKLGIDVTWGEGY